MSERRVILSPTIDDEIEAVQLAVISVMHVLMEIAQDEVETTDDRLNAIAMILSYAQDAHPYNPEKEEEELDDAEADSIDRFERPVTFRERFRLRYSRGNSEFEDDEED